MLFNGILSILTTTCKKGRPNFPLFQMTSHAHKIEDNPLDKAEPNLIHIYKKICNNHLEKQEPLPRSLSLKMKV